MSDKPLHVQVAEALGCKPEYHDSRYSQGWFCPCRRGDHAEPDPPRLLNYNTDWSATGPLIERYRITVSDVAWPGPWAAYRGLYISEGGGWDDAGSGETPLIAVCALILALHAAGKLPK